jgi:hypothetical protein
MGFFRIALPLTPDRAVPIPQADVPTNPVKKDMRV